MMPLRTLDGERDQAKGSDKRWGIGKTKFDIEQ
jgi:hypothetical protein